MECLYKQFYTETHVKAIGQFLEIVSASSCGHTKNNDTPITLKEG